jgi:hypothetical protein
LVNQTLQQYSYLLKLINETKEEKEKGGEQIESETEKTSKFSSTRIVFSIFQSLANARTVMVTSLFKPYLHAMMFDLRRFVRENKDICF